MKDLEDKDRPGPFSSQQLDAPAQSQPVAPGAGTAVSGAQGWGWGEVVQELRTTDKPQAHGFLRSAEGFCCLGIICELALEKQWPPGSSERGWGAAWNYRFTHEVATDSSRTGLPWPLARYLGITTGASVHVRVPQQVVGWMEQRGGDDTSVSWHSFILWRDRRARDESRAQISLVNLNDDWHLPFAQIADCIEFTFLPDAWARTLGQRADDAAGD